MCRNIKLLHDLLPPATTEEIKLSALQYVRKLSGMQKPSQANQHVFDRAVSEVVTASTRLLRSLEPGRAHTREELQLKAAERGRRREAQNRERVLATLKAHSHGPRQKRAARRATSSPRKSASDAARRT